MKTKILVGAVAALLYSGAALAQGQDCPPGYKATQSMNSQAVGSEPQAATEAQPVEQGTGSSGQAGVDQGVSTEQPSVQTEPGVGGSGQQQGQMVPGCEPVQEGAVEQGAPPSQGAGGSGYVVEPAPQPAVAPPAVPATSEPSGAFAPVEPVKEKKGPNMRGLSLTLGGGVEGYTGGLAPELNPGPAYGVQAEFRPTNVFGLELAYSGAVNNLDARLRGGSTNSPDLVRNGGQAALTLGLTATPVQPYVLGGVGFSDYNFRGAAAEFRDDTVGNVPVGAGLRTQIGDFTADLRGNYNFLFSQDFSPNVNDGLNGNGRYSGTLNIGGTF